MYTNTKTTLHIIHFQQCLVNSENHFDLQASYSKGCKHEGFGLRIVTLRHWEIGSDESNKRVHESTLNPSRLRRRIFLETTSGALNQRLSVTPQKPAILQRVCKPRPKESELSIREWINVNTAALDNAISVSCGHTLGLLQLLALLFSCGLTNESTKHCRQA